MSFIKDLLKWGAVRGVRDPVTGRIGIQGSLSAPFGVVGQVPNSLALLGDSLTGYNYIATVVASASITAGVLSVVMSVADSYQYAGSRCRIVNFTDSAGTALDGNYSCLSRSGSGPWTYTFAAPTGAVDGSCTLGTCRLYNLQLLADNGPITWLNILSKQKFEVVGMIAAHGATSTQILAKLQSIITLNPAYCSVLAGTNDVSAISSQGQIAAVVATLVSNLQSIYAGLLNAGIQVFAFTIPPVGSAVANYALINAAIIEANKYIRLMARSTYGVLLIDAYAVIVDPLNATAGLPKTNMLQSDGIHWTALGAFTVGTAANTATSNIANLYDDRTNSNADNYGANAVNRNLLDNAPWTNSGGTVTGPVTGTMAAGWQVYKGGGVTVATASIPARSDGYGYDATLATTPTANNDVGAIATVAGVPNARLSANTDYRFDMSVAVSGISGSNLKQLVCASQPTVDGVALYMAAGLYGSNTAQPTADWNGVVRSPYFKFTGAITGALPLNATSWFSGAGTALTHSVGRVSVRAGY